MKLLLVTAALLLVGCATEPPVDPDCDHVAKYARAVAQLRDIGVPLNDTTAYSSEPIALTFPFQYVRWKTYQEKDTPGLTAQKTYLTCTAQGYPNLLTSLNAQERVRQKTLQQQGK